LPGRRQHAGGGRDPVAIDVGQSLRALGGDPHVERLRRGRERLEDALVGAGELLPDEADPGDDLVEDGANALRLGVRDGLDVALVGDERAREGVDVLLLLRRERRRAARGVPAEVALDRRRERLELRLREGWARRVGVAGELDAERERDLLVERDALEVEGDVEVADELFHGSFLELLACWRQLGREDEQKPALPTTGKAR